MQHCSGRRASSLFNPMAVSQLAGDQDRLKSFENAGVQQAALAAAV
jgi:hypothetical protein